MKTSITSRAYHILMSRVLRDEDPRTPRRAWHQGAFRCARLDPTSLYHVRACLCTTLCGILSEEVEAMNRYEQIIRSIQPANSQARQEAASYIDSLIKPMGSLGRLETLAIDIAGITGNVRTGSLKKRARVMAEGKSGMTVLAKEAGSDYLLVDVGINTDEKIPGLLNRKIARGTANFTKSPAMTREMCIKAIETGIDIVLQLKEEGCELIGTGELGMGNTTSSACVLMGLTGLTANEAVGKGAGLTDVAFENKKSVAARAIAVNEPNADDPIDVLSKVGGFDIAGLVGVYLGAAYCRIPVVIDGFISAVAALAASRLCPAAADFMIPSHCSAEPGFSRAMKELGKEPVLFMDMRLGEGSGCPLAFHLIDAALAMVNGMATFKEASVDRTQLVDIRER